MAAIGKRVWAIAEGWIPQGDGFTDRALASHETACILNAGESDAHIDLTIFFADREPVHYALTVPARRTRHVRFDDLTDPPVPRGTDYAFAVRVRRAGGGAAHAARFPQGRDRADDDAGVFAGLGARRHVNLPVPNTKKTPAWECRGQGREQEEGSRE